MKQLSSQTSGPRHPRAAPETISNFTTGSPGGDRAAGGRVSGRRGPSAPSCTCRHAGAVGGSRPAAGGAGCSRCHGVRRRRRPRLARRPPAGGRRLSHLCKPPRVAWRELVGACREPSNPTISSHPASVRQRHSLHGARRRPDKIRLAGCVQFAPSTTNEIPNGLPQSQGFGAALGEALRRHDAALQTLPASAAAAREAWADGPNAAEAGGRLAVGKPQALTLLEVRPLFSFWFSCLCVGARSTWSPIMQAQQSGSPCTDQRDEIGWYAYCKQWGTVCRQQTGLELSGGQRRVPFWVAVSDDKHRKSRPQLPLCRLLCTARGCEWSCRRWRACVAAAMPQVRCFWPWNITL